MHTHVKKRTEADRLSTKCCDECHYQQVPHLDCFTCKLFTKVRNFTENINLAKVYRDANRVVNNPAAALCYDSLWAAAARACLRPPPQSVLQRTPLPCLINHSVKAFPIATVIFLVFFFIKFEVFSGESAFRRRREGGHRCVCKCYRKPRCQRSHGTVTW